MHRRKSRVKRAIRSIFCFKIIFVLFLLLIFLLNGKVFVLSRRKLFIFSYFYLSVFVEKICVVYQALGPRTEVGITLKFVDLEQKQNKLS